MFKLELHTWGSPPCPEHTHDDEAWAKWTEEHKAWRGRKDAVLAAAIFALDDQITRCGLLEGDCEVCDLSATARKALWDALSPEGRSAVDTARLLAPIVADVLK